MTLIRKVYQTRKYGHSWINVHKHGEIRLSQRLSIALDVKHGDCVAFYQDDKEPHIWFIRKEDDGLKINKANRSYFKVNSSFIASDILESIKTNRTVKIKVSTARQRDGMFQILISTAINMKGEKIY